LPIIEKADEPGARFISLVFITSSGDPTQVATNPEANALEICSGLPSGMPIF
jgi:hypothetical protein